MPAPPGLRLPAPLQVAWLVADPMRFFAAGRRLGPVFQIRLPGMPPEVCVATADLAEQVLAADGSGGRAGAVRRGLLGPLVGEASLLTLDEEPWWRHRRLLGPPLHGRAVARWAERVAELAAADIDRWPLGEPFALRPRMERITLEVIMRVVFGIRDAGRLRRLRVLLPRLVALGGGAAVVRLPPRPREWLLTAPAARRAGFLPTTRFARIRAQVDAILYDEMARRRRDGAPDAGPAADDVLSQLLAARDEAGRPLTDREVRDELITLLVAGHETTATALAWTFERLVRTPPVLERLREEPADGDGRAYLDAVIKESLRVRPVVPATPRLLTEPMTVGGHRVPAGWCVAAVIPLVHTDPDVFPDPGEFRPERFLGPEAAKANRAWLPFGGGRRYCAGAQLALLEMRTIVAEVLRRVELRPADPAPERVRLRAVSLVPARSARVVAARRGSAAV
jgi:cytochrome P450